MTIVHGFDLANKIEVIWAEEASEHEFHGRQFLLIGSLGNQPALLRHIRDPEFLSASFNGRRLIRFTAT